MGSPKSNVVVIGDSEIASAPWVQRIDARAAPCPPLPRAPHGRRRVPVSGPGCVLIDGRGDDPLACAQAVRADDEAVQVVIVAPQDRRRALEREILFTPGLADIWLATPDDVSDALVSRAAAVTGQRRRFAATAALRAGDAPPTDRGAASDSYLARVLDVLGDPVFSIDADGRVLSANRAAVLLLGKSERELMHERLADLLSPNETAELDDLFIRATSDAVRAEASVCLASGERGPAEIAVTPAGDGVAPVRVVVVRDVSAGRRIQDALRAQTAELAGVNARLHLAAEEANEARGAAEAANEAKSVFLATMSHEIRTPINAVIGYAELLDLGVAGPLTEHQREYLRRMRTSSRHLLTLVNEVLDLAKIDAGQLITRTATADIGAPIDAAITLAHPLALERGIALSAECVGDPQAPFIGDEDRVRQIIVNLLSNAVKFTRPGGSITIECGTTAEPDPDAKLEPGHAWTFVRVRDTGVGIEPDQLERIFAPFVQGETGHTRTRGGTGLGLTISRRLARLMQGELTAQSGAAGSVFTLWLPAQDVGAPSVVAQRVSTIAAGRVTGLAVIGKQLLDRVGAIQSAFVARLRAEPGLPGTDLAFALLADHTVTLLSDIGESLIALEQTNGAPTALIADGSDIQRLIGERHGAQRARLGWTQDGIRREYAILVEEIEQVIRSARVEETGSAEVAASVARQLLAQTTEASIAAMRRG